MSSLSNSLLALMVATQAAGPTELVSYQVKPSDTDARITRFDNPHNVVFNRSTPSSADLFVHMVGTGGVAANRKEYLAIVAAQGYRVISLSYNNTPAVVARCPRQADPACSGGFRRERLFGENVSAAIDDRPEESIINRLVKLLQHLDREHPGAGWASYLRGDGPDWERIAFGGHSQGAGMAAYLARQKQVARVVLLSGPTDFLLDRSLAPWIDGPGATPSDRWYALYHQKEATASLIADAYRRLRIPESHVRMLTLEHAPFERTVANARVDFYHVSVYRWPFTPKVADGTAAYLQDWLFLVGRSR
jgi:acetyl esterase/lipase